MLRFGGGAVVSDTDANVDGTSRPSRISRAGRAAPAGRRAGAELLLPPRKCLHRRLIHVRDMSTGLSGWRRGLRRAGRHGEAGPVPGLTRRGVTGGENPWRFFPE